MTCSRITRDDKRRSMLDCSLPPGKEIQGRPSSQKWPELGKVTYLSNLDFGYQSRAPNRSAAANFGPCLLFRLVTAPGPPDHTYSYLGFISNLGILLEFWRRQRTYDLVTIWSSPAMATLNGGLPSVKVEDASSMMIKDETMDDALSPYMEDDIYEDAGDLDFSNAEQRVWLSHIPISLWETLSALEGDDEIEIGTLRVEGPESQPSRVSYSALSRVPGWSIHIFLRG